MIQCTFEDGNKANLRHVVIDTIVLNDNKILLVKRVKTLLEGGKWGLVGGYVERGETLEHAVEREVYEETGWRIDKITLLRIIDNPDRPHEDRQNISFVYFCQAIKHEGEADWESDEQKWFDLDSLPPHDKIAFDHAENIDLYLKAQTK